MYTFRFYLVLPFILSGITISNRRRTSTELTDSCKLVKV